jgi:hypothetical protein
MKRILLGVSLILTATLGSAASAHDFFLMPEEFHAPAPGALAIKATVGSNFPTPEILVPADRAERLVASGAGSPKLTVVGPGSTSLYLEATGAEPGLLVAGVSSKPRDVDYAEDRIPLILEEYRVAPSAAAAVERLPRPRTWLVSSRRFAKSFVCVQSCSNRSAGERPLGFDLEFVGSGGGEDHFLLLAKGQPVANYPVDLVGADGKRQHLTTDARGAVHLPATARGKMMLFAAALAPPPAGAERFVLDLTSLTLERR